MRWRNMVTDMCSRYGGDKKDGSKVIGLQNSISSASASVILIILDYIQPGSICTVKPAHSGHIRS